MSFLLMPKFLSDCKSPSCNANAINVLFIGSEVHTHNDTPEEGRGNISSLFIIFFVPAWMMEAQNEGVGDERESNCPLIHYSNR